MKLLTFNPLAQETAGFRKVPLGRSLTNTNSIPDFAMIKTFQDIHIENRAGCQRQLLDHPQQLLIFQPACVFTGNILVCFGECNLRSRLVGGFYVVADGPENNFADPPFKRPLKIIERDFLKSTQKTVVKDFLRDFGLVYILSYQRHHFAIEQPVDPLLSGPVIADAPMNETFQLARLYGGGITQGDRQMNKSLSTSIDGLWSLKGWVRALFKKSISAETAPGS